MREGVAGRNADAARLPVSPLLPLSQPQADSSSGIKKSPPAAKALCRRRACDAGAAPAMPPQQSSLADAAFPSPPPT
ncbi:unnamed protein product [Lampetra fluviatilis]